MGTIGGVIFIDGKEVAETKQCCHCGGHWIVKPGSGTIRGFCLKCGKHTCGAPECNLCIPFQQKIEEALNGNK